MKLFVSLFFSTCVVSAAIAMGPHSDEGAQGEERSSTSTPTSILRQQSAAQSSSSGVLLTTYVVQQLNNQMDEVVSMLESATFDSTNQAGSIDNNNNAVGLNRVQEIHNDDERTASSLAHRNRHSSSPRSKIRTRDEFESGTPLNSNVGALNRVQEIFDDSDESESPNQNIGALNRVQEIHNHDDDNDENTPPSSVDVKRRRTRGPQ